MRTIATYLAVGCAAASAALVAPACEHATPYYCDESTPCLPRYPDRPYCDLTGEYGTGHMCIADPTVPDAGPMCTADAGGCPAAVPFCVEGQCVECAASADCTDPARPVCDASGTCQPCAAEADCAARPATPHCAPAGQCVECLDGSHCVPAAPVCDTANWTCRGCVLDAECAELCDDASGACVPEADIIYVDAAVAASGPTCAKAAPCKTIAEGVARVTASRSRIKVAPGTYAEGVTLNNITVRIVGPGASINPVSSNQACVVVQGTSTVTLDGMTLLGALGGSNADGLRCEGSAGLTDLVIRGVTIRSNEAQGLDAANCSITVERTRVDANSDGGILLTNADFTIRNTFIVANGRTTGGGSAFGGVQVGAPPSGPAGARFEFNTVADNTANVAVAAGVICPVATAIPASNVIVYGNGTALQVSGMCSWTYSDIGQAPTPGGMGNINMDPQFVNIAGGDYHIGAGSPCVNAGDPAASVGVDFDGDARPGGGGYDIGADEVP